MYYHFVYQPTKGSHLNTINTFELCPQPFSNPLLKALFFFGTVFESSFTKVVLSNKWSHQMDKLQGSISSTRLLLAQIPKVQKILTTWLSFFSLQDLHAWKLLVERWWNWPQESISSNFFRTHFSYERCLGSISSYMYVEKAVETTFVQKTCA